MDIKYIRISSKTQKMARQQMNLSKFDKVFEDVASGKDSNREGLTAMIDFVREGDTVYVESYSRLARNTVDLLRIIKQLTDKGVNVVSEKEGFDTRTPSGKLMLTMFGALYTFEREMLLERQKEGYEACRLANKHVGRNPYVKDKKYFDVVARWKNGEITAVKAYKELGISKALFYKLVKEE